MNLSALKRAVSGAGGSVTDVGYTSYGSYTKAHVETDGLTEVSVTAIVDGHEDLTVEEWGDGHMFGLVLAERR